MTDCRHECCNERRDPFHSHFLDPPDCPACRRARRCPACGAPVARARDESGAVLLLGEGPSWSRGTLELVPGGHPEGGLLARRAVRDGRERLLYTDHTECGGKA